MPSTTASRQTRSPALEEMRELMFGGKLTIAGHNREMREEMRNYHRDEDFKIAKQRDDLVSAFEIRDHDESIG
jgi:hypothetical protein